MHTRYGDIARAIDILRTAAGGPIRSAARDLSDSRSESIAFSIRQPLGVVGAITPWNAPFLTRRRAWRVLSETSGLRLPRLEYPDHPERPDTDSLSFPPFNSYRDYSWRGLVARGGGRSYAQSKVPLATLTSDAH